MNEILCVLRDAGNDVDGALARFMGNEAMYLKFLGKLGKDESFAQLAAAVAAGDAQAGFAAAHTLKGLFGNLGLTKLVELNTPLVEAMRAGSLPQAGEVEALREEYEATLALLEGLAA